MRLTDAPPAGTSSRTVIEYETEGTALTPAWSHAPSPSRIRREPLVAVTPTGSFSWGSARAGFGIMGP